MHEGNITPNLVFVRGRCAAVHEHLDDLEVAALGGDVQRRRVRDLVPRVDHHRLVELHQLQQHAHRALGRSDVRARAAVLK